MFQLTHFQAENLDKILNFLAINRNERIFFERIKFNLLSDLSIKEFEKLIYILDSNEEIVFVKIMNGKAPTARLNFSGYMQFTNNTEVFMKQGGFLKLLNLEMLKEEKEQEKENLKTKGTKIQIGYYILIAIVSILGLLLHFFKVSQNS